MDKLCFRIVIYNTKSKYERKWDLESKRLVWQPKTIEEQKQEYITLYQGKPTNNYGVLIHFYEVFPLTGEIKLIETWIYEDLKPAPRVLNNDPSSDTIKEEANDTELD